MKRLLSATCRALLLFILCVLVGGGCDAQPGVGAVTTPTPARSSTASEEEPPAPIPGRIEASTGSSSRKDLRLASRPQLLSRLRSDALDDGLILRREAIAMTIGPRQLRLKRIVASLEGTRWGVTLMLRNGCYYYAVIEATTGRSTAGGSDC
jgi:hypothetical protein